MRIMNEDTKECDQINFLEKKIFRLQKENKTLRQAIAELNSQQKEHLDENDNTIKIHVPQGANDIYERSSLGVFRISKNRKNNFANSALYELLGLDKRNDSLEDNKNRWLPSVQALIRFVEKYNCFSAGRKCSLNRQYVKPDGEKIFLNVSIQKVLDWANAEFYYEGIVEDITIQKMARETLMKAKEEAEKSDRLKTEFLSQMSHEIRTPINTLLNFVSLIEEETKLENYENLDIYFDSIQNSGNRIVRTMDLILNMSEIRSGTYEYTKKTCDVYKDVLKKLYVDFSKEATKKNIRLRFVNENVSPMVFGDRVGIQNILVNLIDNAIKYTHEGEVLVKVSSNLHSNVVVEVKDTGIGISQDYLKTLFSPFTQEEQGYTRKFDGNGLGLALSMEYARINNAKIEVISTKGKGSTFRVIFQ